MNDIEAQRIAAAINQLRPDWPVASLVTLLARPGLTHRHRRDVAVALAWVACDADTRTPARVLEDGPWWTAVAERVGYRPPPFDTVCATCSRTREMCERIDGGDHEFISNHEYRIELARKRAKETA
jgi:hypothetical protein